MMKKCIPHIFLLLICLSCSEKLDNHNRIIYELSKGTSSKILEVYKKEKSKSKESYFYVTVDRPKGGTEDFYLHLNSCTIDLKCIYSDDLFKKTNRF